MLLRQALGWQRGEMISLIGGGTKSPLLYRLAKELRDDGARIMLTTTKRMAKPVKPHVDRLFLVDRIDDFNAAAATLAAPVVIAAGTAMDADGNLLGFTKEWLDQVNLAGSCDAVLVSASEDGAQLLDLSESGAAVIPATCQLTVWLVDVNLLGKALVEPWVKDAARAGKLLNATPSSVVDAATLTCLAQHPAGCLKDIPAASRKVALIHQAQTPDEIAAAKALALSLSQAGVASAVILS